MSTVIQHIKQAAAHEDAAGRHVEKYEGQMKAAGASMYAAFQMAAKDAPELQGRKIDDAAITRLYQSSKPRPWWDKALVAAGITAKGAKGVGDRERAARLIQWHVDPEAAKSRSAQRQIQQAAAQRALRARRSAAAAEQTRGMTSSHKIKAGPSTAAMREIHVAGQAAALAGRGLQVVAGGKQAGDHAAASSLEDLLAEVNRIQSAVRKVKPDDRTAVFEILRVTAREIEEHHA